MSSILCAICGHEMTSSTSLKSHYMKTHQKLQLVEKLVNGSTLKLDEDSMHKLLAEDCKQNDVETIILNDQVHSFTIEDDSDSENFLELSVNNLPFYFLSLPEGEDDRESGGCVRTRGNRRSKRNKKQRKFFHIDIRRKVQETPKSLCESTGEFYECHCKENYSNQSKASSDTESCPDMAPINFYCNTCGNGYTTAVKLKEHEKVHLFVCKMCQQSFTYHDYIEHIEQHVIKVYACYWCELEFISKELLIAHLGHHFEQQTFENILNMEQEYNIPNNYSHTRINDDYFSHLDNIKFFLTYPYDHYYSRMLLQVTCHLCLKKVHVSDLATHLDTVHYSN